jgi:hypothetical protein
MADIFSDGLKYGKLERRHVLNINNIPRVNVQEKEREGE